MAGYVAIAIEGVLARAGEGDNLVACQPLVAGLQIYRTLRRGYKVALLAHERDESKILHWLRTNDVSDYTTVLAGGGAGEAERPAARREEQLRTLRGRGYALDLVIDASPAVIAKAMHMGITALLFASPAYARPEFRPDAPRGIREWADMEGEIALQRELRTAEPPRTADLYE